MKLHSSVVVGILSLKTCFVHRVQEIKMKHHVAKGCLTALVEYGEMGVGGGHFASACVKCGDRSVTLGSLQNK